jgi:hypothetical protein
MLCPQPNHGLLAKKSGTFSTQFEQGIISIDLGADEFKQLS